MVIIPNPEPARSAPNVSGGIEFTMGGMRAAAIPRQITSTAIHAADEKMVAAKRTVISIEPMRMKGFLLPSLSDAKP